MSSSTRRRFANPLSVWIALLAIVLQSVMPMVAQARLRTQTPVVLADQAAPQVERSHADASHTGHASAHPTDHGVAPVDPPSNPHALHGDAPCPYCRVHLDAVALPALPAPHWVLLVAIVQHPVDEQAVPALAQAWSPTGPRGPPSIS